MSAATILFNTGLYTESGGRKYTNPTCFFFLFLKKILVILGRVCPFYFHMSFRIAPHTLDLSGNLEPRYKDCLGIDVLRTGADSKAG